jgi:hypothetical protein
MYIYPCIYNVLLYIAAPKNIFSLYIQQLTQQAQYNAHSAQCATTQYGQRASSTKQATGDGGEVENDENRRAIGVDGSSVSWRVVGRRSSGGVETWRGTTNSPHEPRAASDRRGKRGRWEGASPETFKNFVIAGLLVRSSGINPRHSALPTSARAN